MASPESVLSINLHFYSAFWQQLGYLINFTLHFFINLNVSATIEPNIQNWITSNQNRIIANNCKIKLRFVDLTLLAESGLTGGHISDFVMKEGNRVHLLLILKASFELVCIN